MNDISLYFFNCEKVIHKISDKIATHTQLSDTLCHNGSNEERDFFYVDNRIVFNFARRMSTVYPMLQGNYKGFLLRKILFFISFCTIGKESHISLQIATGVRYLKVPARISLEVLSDEQYHAMASSFLIIIM